MVSSTMKKFLLSFIFEMIIFIQIKASKLYSKGGDVAFSWTLDPVPGSSEPVTVVDRHGNNLFVARATFAVLAGSYQGRITYTGNTTAGRISFTLQNVTVADGGLYSSRYDASTYPGQTLVVIAKPSKPTVFQETVPEINTSLILRCSATSNSIPDSETTMTYTWNIPSNMANMQTGSRITINSIKLTYNGSSLTCAAQDIGGIHVIYSNVSENSLPYVIYQLYGPQSSPTLSHTSPQSAVEGAMFPDITCNRVLCNPVCNYTWIKQGQGTVSSVSGRLVLGRAEKNDKGTYYCTSSNSYGSRNSTNIIIEVLYGPNKPSLSQSSPVTVEQGRQVPSITCTADCNPGCSYTWTKRGQGTITSQNGVLSLGNADRSEDGTYYCTATNTYGTQNSDNIDMDVQYGPNKPSLSQSSPVTVEQGRQVPSITCTADCNPGCSYTWTKRGQGTITSQNRVLSLGNADRSEDGTYYCTATNTYGTQNSDNIDMDVQYGPNKTSLSQSSPVTVEQGRQVPSITCTADCNPGCSYTWTKRGQGTITSQNGVLSLGNADRSEDGTYYCTATNTYGTHNSDDIDIDVQYRPHAITFTPSNRTYTMLENTTIGEINCSADCNPRCMYKWNGKSTNVLRLGSVTRQKAGIYVCNASNVIGYLTDKIKITVNYPPQIASLVISGGGQKIMEGHNVIISCNVDSNPAATITWSYRYNNTIETFPQISNTNDVLKLEDVICTQTGTYICNADNGIGASVIKEILLEVFCGPRLNITSIDPETNIAIAISTKTEFKLTANFISYPLPQIEWYFQTSSYQSNQTLQNGLNNVQITVTSSLYTISTNLVRTKLSESIFGYYKALASNSFGRSTKTFIVTPMRKPYTPNDLQVKCKYHNEAEISWTPGFNGGTRQTFAIEYSRSVGIKIITVTVPSNVKDENRKLTDTVVDLDQNTLYLFKVIANNMHGSTGSKEVVNCTTGGYTESVHNGESIAWAVVGCLSVVLIIVVAGILVFVRRQKLSKRENEVAMKETRSDAEYEDLKSGEDNAAYERIKRQGHEHGNENVKGNLTYEQLQMTSEAANYENLSVNGQKSVAHSSRDRNWNGNREDIVNSSKSGEMNSQSEKVYENTVVH